MTKRLLCCLAALSLAACGASGGLYLPGQEPHKSNPLGKNSRNTQPQQSPAPAPPATAPGQAAPSATAPNAPAPTP